MLTTRGCLSPVFAGRGILWHALTGGTLKTRPYLCCIASLLFTIYTVLPKPQDLPIELSPAGAVVFLLLAAPGLTLKPLVCLCHIIAFRQAGSFLTTI